MSPIINEIERLEFIRERQRKYNKIFKEKHPERIKANSDKQEQKRRYDSKRQAYIKGYQSAYYNTNAYYKQVTTIVYRAIKAGKLVRPNKCSKCNSTVNIQAHHEDYAKPLEVIWLCKICHINIHRI